MDKQKITRLRASAILIACLSPLILASTASAQVFQQITPVGRYAVISQSDPPVISQSEPPVSTKSPDAVPVEPAVAKAPVKRSKPKATAQERPVSPSISQSVTNSTEPGNSQPTGNGIKDFGSKAKAETPSKQPSMFLSPEFRSPVNALTPADPIGRDPFYDRNAPGVSAIIHSGKNTEIHGVFSLPGSNSGTPRPYGQQEGGGKDAPSGGVMLKQTF
jgi:hypothetical protein